MSRFLIPGSVAVGLACIFLLLPSLGHAAGCRPSATVPGWQVVTVHSGGLSRDVPLYVPASLAGRSGVPVVFDLHGSGGNGRQQALNSGLTTQADQHGFILANPNGGIADPDGSPDKFYWNVPGVPLTGGAQAPANAPDDVQFFRDAIQQLEAAVCVDSHRIYLTGFSGGARMTSALACELSDRIAAFAPVSGLRAGVPKADDPKSLEASTCKPRRAVSILTFHGVNDPQNRFDGDGTPRWGYSVADALERWKSLDGCHSPAAEIMVSPHVTKVTFPGCRNGAELILYRTDAPVEHGGGHIWPHPTTVVQASASNANQVDQLDASALIWEFFARHHS